MPLLSAPRLLISRVARIPLPNLTLSVMALQKDHGAAIVGRRVPLQFAIWVRSTSRFDYVAVLQSLFSILLRAAV